MPSKNGLYVLINTKFRQQYFLTAFLVTGDNDELMWLTIMWSVGKMYYNDTDFSIKMNLRHHKDIKKYNFPN